MKLKTDTSANNSAVSPTRLRIGGISNDRQYNKKVPRYIESSVAAELFRIDSHFHHHKLLYSRQIVS